MKSTKPIEFFDLLTTMAIAGYTSDDPNMVVKNIARRNKKFFPSADRKMLDVVIGHAHPAATVIKAVSNLLGDEVDAKYIATVIANTGRFHHRNIANDSLSPQQA